MQCNLAQQHACVHSCQPPSMHAKRRRQPLCRSFLHQLHLMSTLPMRPTTSDSSNAAANSDSGNVLPVGVAMWWLAAAAAAARLSAHQVHACKQLHSHAAVHAATVQKRPVQRQQQHSSPTAGASTPSAISFSVLSSAALRSASLMAASQGTSQKPPYLTSLRWMVRGRVWDSTQAAVQISASAASSHCAKTMNAA